MKLILAVFKKKTKKNKVPWISYCDVGITLVVCSNCIDYTITFT